MMVVLVVVAIGIMTLSGVQTRSSVDVYSTGRDTRALSLAQARMEAVRAGGFANVAPDTGQADGFTWQTQVDSLSDDLFHVGVTVAWDESGEARSLQIDNLISDR